MRLLCLTFGLAICTTFLNITRSVPPKIKKILGVNGHPLVQEAYQGNQKLQIDLIKNIGFSSYRIDIPMKSNYSTAEKKHYSNTFTNFTSAKVNLVPVLINTENLSGLTLNQVYLKGQAQGALFANTWGKFFKYYEVENEVDNKTILGPQFTGEEINQYDQNKLKIQLAYIKGLIDGIRSKSSAVKIIINFSYLHTGYLKILEANHINYDIIGMHWYSEMGNLYPVSADGIVDLVSKKFKKKIWLTEFNLRNTGSTLTKEEVFWWTKNFDFLLQKRAVEAIFVYELFDEPAFGDAGNTYNAPIEANYGLVHWGKRYTDYVYKPLLELIKQQIKKFSN